MATDMSDALAVSLRPVLRAWEAWVSDMLDSMPRPNDLPRAIAEGPTPDRVLIVGSGPAVGWGVASHELALPGVVARALRAGTGRGAVVDVIADERWTIEDAGRALASASLTRYDTVILALGTADVMTGMTSRAWRDALHDVLAQWRESAGSAGRLVITDVPRISSIPGLHGAVARWADRRANEFTEIVRERVGSEEGVWLVRLPRLRSGVEEAQRRRTPGDYALWGTTIAAAIMDELDRAAGGAPVASRFDPSELRRNDLLVLSLSEHRTRLEWIAAVAAAAFRAPTALITVLGPDRQWHAARIRFSPESIPLDQSFCLYTVEHDEPLVVEDASLDPRFADNPLVTGADHVRFYAGAAIEASDGRRIGALCVIDSEPRHDVTAAERALLASLARRVQNVIWSAEDSLQGVA
jgi:hypothetical protein